MSSSAGNKLQDLQASRVASGYAYGGYPAVKIGGAGISSINKVSTKYGIPFEWLVNLMNHESAGTFNPQIQNSIGATGLIQFLPSTAASLGTSTSALAAMSFVKQMEYVDAYIGKSLKNKLEGGKIPSWFTQTDLFMTIFYPKSIGDALYKFPSNVVAANNVSTPLEYTQKALSHAVYSQGEAPSTLQAYKEKNNSWLSSFSKNNLPWWLLPAIIITFGSAVTIGIYYYQAKR